MALDSPLGADSPLSSADQGAIDELAGIRQSIDNIDAALVHMLAERFKYTQSVGLLKAAAGMPASDPERRPRASSRARRRRPPRVPVLERDARQRRGHAHAGRLNQPGPTRP